MQPILPVFSNANHTPPPPEVPIHSEMNDIHVCKSGLKALLLNLDQRKVGGPDGLTAIILKKFAHYIPSFVDCVHFLVSKSVELGDVPRIWKCANVAPIYKGGDRADVNNYRPISLTCILSKITEHIICSSIWEHVDQFGIITNRQHGFRKCLNTTTQLLHVAHHASKALNDKLNHHIISFDFSKAFD